MCTEMQQIRHYIMNSTTNNYPNSFSFWYIQNLFQAIIATDIRYMNSKY